MNHRISQWFVTMPNEGLIVLYFGSKLIVEVTRSDYFSRFQQLLIHFSVVCSLLRVTLSRSHASIFSLARFTTGWNIFGLKMVGIRVTCSLIKIMIELLDFSVILISTSESTFLLTQWNLIRLNLAMFTACFQYFKNASAVSSNK